MTDDSPAARRVRVLVTGSRDWTDQQAIYDALDTISRLSTVDVVHGACPKGADYWAGRWARENAVFADTGEHSFPANWQRDGKRAGFLRNLEMATAGADVCLAFIRNGSSGASHCARAAESVGIPTIIFRQDCPDLSQVALALAASPPTSGEGK